MNLPEINQYHAGPIASRPHFLRHDMRFQLLALVISMGFEVTPWFSLGAGVIPSIDSIADQDNFAGINKTEDIVMGQRLSIHQTAKMFVVPVLGLLLKPPLPLLEDIHASLGASFRGENKGHNGKGPLNQVIGVENPYGDPTFGIYYPSVLSINLVSFAPRQVTVGLACKPLQGLTLAYDMTWKDWSQYETYLETRPNPPFKDTFTHRFGVEYAWDPGFSTRYLDKVSKLCLRGGYYFEPTPVEPLDPWIVEQRLPSDNIFDTDLDVFSAGLCITIAGKTMEHDIEIFYQYQHLHDLSRMAFIDSIYGYLNGIPIRDEYIPVEIGGEIWAVGGCYTLRF